MKLQHRNSVGHEDHVEKLYASHESLRELLHTENTIHLVSELESKRVEVEKLELFTSHLEKQIKEKEEEFIVREMELKQHLSNVSALLH